MNSDRNVANNLWAKGVVGVALLLAVGLAISATALAQKKKKKDDTPAAASNTAPLGDDQKIDYAIGEMLGAWQIGDIDKLHKNMADDVSVVAGTWSPPAMGWPSFLAAYQVQRARMQQVRMDRRNTLIRIAASGNFAWACYQWDFSAVVDGTPSAAEGQTTLVFEKRGDSWLIVHNHTSIVQSSQPAGPATATPQTQPTPPTPAKP